MIDPVDDAAIEAWFAGVAARHPGRPATTYAYGPSSEQVVELWPADHPDAPVVVSIHGGAFMAEFDLTLHHPVCRRLQTRGFEVHNVEYRRTGSAADASETVADARSAVRAVRERTGRDVAVFGHSAGGFLAEWVADEPGVALTVPLAPITDLVRWREVDTDGCLDAWLGTPGGASEDDLARLSPDPRRAGLAPRTFVHGDADAVVPVQHSREHLAGVAPGSARLHELPDEGHYAFLDPDAPAFEAVLSVLAAWRTPHLPDPRSPR